MKFRKKPIAVNAFQWTTAAAFNPPNWPDWIAEAVDRPADAEGALHRPGDNGNWQIETLEGPHIVSWNAWIVQGPNPPHEIWAVRDDIFEATYEPVEDS